MRKKTCRRNQMSSKQLQAFLKENLQELKDNGLYNEIDTVDGPNGAIISVNGKDLINMSSNNYLGFSNDERLKKKAIEATEKYGVGAGAVRTINGTQTIHDQLEEKLANFKQTEAAIALQSGFNSNIGAIPAIMTKKDAIL